MTLRLKKVCQGFGDLNLNLISPLPQKPGQLERVDGLTGQGSGGYVSALTTPTARAGNLMTSSSLVTFLMRKGTLPSSVRPAS